MKRCSKCGRTYEESLTFCLEDGTVLSAPYDPQVTLQNTVRATGEPPPTEVLLPKQAPERKTGRSSLPWFLYGSIAFGVVVLFVIAIAWITWAISNSKTSSSSSTETAARSPVTPQPSPTPAAIDISGSWRDAYGNTSRISQSGDSFQMTGRGTACRGVYVATASGTVSGNRIETTYETNYSRGQCQGTITLGGRKITSTCVDSVCGQFLSVAEKVDQ